MIRASEFEFTRANLLAVLLVLVASSVPVLAQTTHYVSNSATASSPCTATAPCKPSLVWNRVSPGDTVVYKDGLYKGEGYTISPPRSLNGSAAQPITVRAETDGGVWIDGEGVRIPVYLYKNNWYVIEGFNAFSSDQNVYHAYNGDYNVFRRCIGWDAADLNYNVFLPGKHSLMEDCAAFGVARKMSNHGYHDGATLRRVWLRWEGGTETGGKIVMDTYYSSKGHTFENVLLTWDNGSMPDGPWYSHDGETILSGPITGWQSGNPRGFTGHGFLPEDTECVDVKIVGSIGYLKGQTSEPYNLFPDGRWLWKENAQDYQPCCYTVDNVVGYIDPSNSEWDDNIALFYTEGCPSKIPPMRVANVSSVAQQPNTIHADWNPANIERATSVSGLGDGSTGGIYARNAICDGPDDPFDCCTGAGTGTCTGAGVCYRYEDGVEGREPLWPWPMNQRILDATTQASAADHKHKVTVCNPNSTPNCSQVWVTDPHAPANVMADMVAMFGPPPPACSGDPGGGNEDPTLGAPEDVWRTDDNVPDPE